MAEFKMEFGFGKRKTFFIEFNAANLNAALKMAEEPSGKFLKQLEEIFIKNKFSVDEGWHNYEVLCVAPIFSKKEKINLLVAEDIISIQDYMIHHDYEYFYAVLTGDGFTSYNNMSENEINNEFNERWDNIKGNFKILELADKFNS